VARWERYEIWIPDGSDWAMESWWREFDFASAVFRAHNGPVRFVRGVCDDEEVVERQIIADAVYDQPVSAQT
jgi:hypothetical protein